MRRRPWIPLLLALAPGLGACGSEAERPGLAPRHLVLVTFEGLRADHTSAYLYARPTTAVELDQAALDVGRGLALDDLARDGVMFSHAFAPSGDPLRSLACLHTGRAAAARDPRPGDAVAADLGGGDTLAEALAARGFECAAFVSGESGELPAAETGDDLGGLLRGFEVRHVAPDDLGALAAAVGWIDGRDWGDGRRVLMWLHLAGPAFPFEPASMRDPYRGVEVDYRSLFTDPAYAGEADGGAAYRAAAHAPGAPPISPADRRRVVARYDGDVALASFRTWYLLDLLRYFSRLQDSVRDAVIAVAGVSGCELERPGVPWGVHDRPHDSSLRVPLVLRHPDSLTGQRIFRRVVDLQDLRPTLEEWSGGEVPADLEGRSLLAVTDSYVARPFPERASCARLEVRSAAGDGPVPVRYTARDLRWRLVVDRACVEARDLTAGEHALHDCDLDPLERTDRADLHPATAGRLFEELLLWCDGEGADA